MSDITKVDKNFIVDTTINKEDIVFYDVKEKPFDLRGVIFENGKFRRMPEADAAAVSGSIKILHSHTAGGRVRFITDSPYVAINVKYGAQYKMPHCAFTGSIGFDLYVKRDGVESYCNSFVPTVDIKESFEKVIDFTGNKEREFTINFPTYSEVCELYIGLSDKATVKAPTPYKTDKPFVFYGSSITQGGCSSRPGSCYTALVSRRFDADHINLGFSGSAKAEDAMAEYISRLDMSLFVYDYDYNANNPEQLANTHEKMFKTVRAANPDLPIIIMPRPNYGVTDTDARHKIIKATYDNAVEAGDKNVYFISSRELMADCKYEGTVDNCHPTDAGFASMAKAVGAVVEKIFEVE